MDMHSRLNKVKSGSDPAFNERFKRYSEQYVLPERVEEA